MVTWLFKSLVFELLKKNTVISGRVASIEKEQIKYFPIKSTPLLRKLSNLFHIEMRLTGGMEKEGKSKLDGQ